MHQHNNALGEKYFPVDALDIPKRAFIPLGSEEI